MKTIYKITLLILVCLNYIGCQREKGCSEEPSQTFYHNIDPYYKELVPFGKPGFTMELTDSATGQKVKFTFNGIDSGYWKEVNQGLNPINCPKSDFDAYQYYNYNCVSGNDSLIRIKSNQFKVLDGRYGGFEKGSFDVLAFEINNKPSLIYLSLIAPNNPKFFFYEFEINGIKYDSVLTSIQPNFQIYPIVYYNKNNGIIAIRTESQLWQLIN